MEELLKDPSVQTAVVVLIVTAINVLIAYIKQKWPTQAALVEKNWCYLQPAVSAAIAAASESLKAGDKTNTALSNIVSKSLTQFADQYKLFEGKDASDSELIAARNEIASAVKKVTE